MKEKTNPTTGQVVIGVGLRGEVQPHQFKQGRQVRVQQTPTLAQQLQHLVMCKASANEPSKISEVNSIAHL